MRSSFKLAPLLLLLYLITPVVYGSEPSSDKLVSTNELNSILSDEQSKKAFEQPEPEFLPVKEAFKLFPSVDNREMTLYWVIADNYFLYEDRFQLTAQLNGKDLAIKPSISGEGKLKYDDYYEKELRVFYHEVTLKLPLPEPHGFLTLSAVSQGCADAGLCYPPQTDSFTFDVENKKVVPGIVATQLSSTLDNPSALTEVKEKIIHPTKQADISILTAIFFAMLGGAILNLMPCVFPVLSMKALSFAATPHNRKKQIRHATFYTLGIVISFVAIAALLLTLKAGGSAIGWGFQLQSPAVISFLVYLFFAMGLSLSGVINFGTQLMGVGDSLTSDEGVKGSFFTGVLAAVVASPCTAPFMGSALGFAMTQPIFIALTVFAALGFGMALPFVILAVFPNLSRFMPRPGIWMETFKQLMAFPMYLSAAWLLWVLGHQTNSDGMAAVVIGCITLAFALWLWERRATNRRFRLFGDLTALAAISVSTAILFSDYIAARDERSLSNSNQPWESYDPQRLAKYRAESQAVFIDLTADWCITCLVNEKAVLEKAEVLDKFKSKNVAYIRGDWTKYDANITSLLESHGRNGVPLYLLFPASPSAEAQILPQILTPEIILSALDKL